MSDDERPIARAWCPVSRNDRVAADTHWLELEAPEIANRAVPGQFVMIGFGPQGCAVPFLPRPNSVAAVRGDRIGLLIRVYGDGSARLVDLEPGDRALLLGPLGVGFDLGSARRVLCVAGGVGLAPFLFLPRWASGTPEVEIRLLYGERRADAVFDPDLIAELSGLDPEIWTEAGDLGRRGLVTAGLDLEGADLLLGCGPTPMLEELRRLALDSETPCQLAVEEHMACGLGTCIGCVIETTDPETGELRYARVCVDGPVFRAERLRW